MNTCRTCANCLRSKKLYTDAAGQKMFSWGMTRCYAAQAYEYFNPDLDRADCENYKVKK